MSTNKTTLPRQIGTVKWFNPNVRNYGFITVDGSDIFVHGDKVRAEDRPLKEGDQVDFGVVRGDDSRLKAVDVKVIARAEPDEAAEFQRAVALMDEM